jgi:long-chain acyl-CoA synthetase
VVVGSNPAVPIIRFTILSINKEPLNVDRIWLKSYVKGVPADINPDVYHSLVEVLEESCHIYAKNPAFYNMGTTLTFAQIDAYARDFAAYLQQELKLKPGDRVALMMPNLLQYPIAMFGILRAGLIVVNVNPLYTAAEVVHQLKDAGAETIIVLANFARTVQKALADTPLKNVIVTDVGDLFSRPKAMIINFVLKNIKKKIPEWHIPHAIPFRTVLAHGKKLPFNRVKIDAQDVAFLQYTGGTTGVSKGAMLTHRNIVSNLIQAETWFQSIFAKGKEIIITSLPLYHIYSLTANCLLIAKIGGLNVLITNPRDFKEIIKAMSRFKFTVLTGVNTLFNSLMKHSEFTKLDFKHVILTLGGGMAVQSAVAERWQKLTGKPILEAYGLTETSPCATVNPTNITKYNGTVGLPVSSTLAAILDEDGKEVPLNNPGELAIKGPQVMRGYWQNPGETQKVFTKDGWLLTGDIATMDENGFVRIVERKKDMILVSGFNVYPNEIEDVITTMPGIREAAVIGVVDENSGEVPKAFIVREDTTITVDQVKAYLKERLTGYKVPKHIKFCDDLPKSNVGKVLRRQLRQSQPAKE